MEQGRDSNFRLGIVTIDPWLTIILATIIFVVIGYFLKEITIIKGLLLILFGSLTAISFYKLFELINRKNDTIGLERGLPAIDGSAGGWRLTRALTMLIITLIFSIPTLLVFFSTTKENAGKMETVSSKNSEKKEGTNIEIRKADTAAIKPEKTRGQ